LIADDNDDLRGMLRSLLEANGYTVREAADGRGAVEAAVGGRPGLIIMDVGMPGLDGLSAAAEIRRHADTAGTPILILSAYDTLEHRTEALAAGAVGFVAKPVDPSELMKTVRLLLRSGDDPAFTA
jgi:two-component system, OmpR family, KDP operon response regulator KdpE